MVALRDSNGSLWFGNDHGLMRLDPLPEERSQPPPVTISEFKVRGVRHTLSALGETEFSGLSLPANQNQLEVGFTGLEFRAGKKLTYQYQLEGAENNWSPATTERTVNYASLSPGSYRFLVRAINSEGLVSAKPASLAFTIVPPIWQRNWFRVLAVLLFASILYAIYRYRVEQLLAVERIRARIATDLHDDIGSTLSQISILSEVASRDIDEPKSIDSLQEIAGLSRQSMEAMSDIVWAIDPEQDRVEQLAHRMRRFASDLSTTDGVRVHFQGPTEEKSLEIETDMRRQIFLIFKESLHNALRHSGCQNIDVNFQASEGRLILTIQDDGCGFDPARARLGLGLISIEQRAGLLGGKAEIISAPGRGTLIRVDTLLNRGRSWPSFLKPRTNG
jgi:two-component sensor histidine kinase